jgi:hypothetical protein
MRYRGWCDLITPPDLRVESNKGTPYRMLKKATVLTRPPRRLFHPPPESAKTDSLPWDAPCPRQGLSE